MLASQVTRFVESSSRVACGMSHSELFRIFLPDICLSLLNCLHLASFAWKARIFTHLSMVGAGQCIGLLTSKSSKTTTTSK